MSSIFLNSTRTCFKQTSEFLILLRNQNQAYPSPGVRGAFTMFYLHLPPPTLCCSLSGGSRDQSQDDGVRHHHGQLPAPRRQGELLPHGHLKPRCDLRGHRLSYRGDRAPRPRSIRLSRRFFPPWRMKCLS